MKLKQFSCLARKVDFQTLAENETEEADISKLILKLSAATHISALHACSSVHLRPGGPGWRRRYTRWPVLAGSWCWRPEVWEPDGWMTQLPSEYERRTKITINTKQVNYKPPHQSQSHKNGVCFISIFQEIRSVTVSAKSQKYFLTVKILYLFTSFTFWDSELLPIWPPQKKHSLLSLPAY